MLRINKQAHNICMLRESVACMIGGLNRYLLETCTHARYTHRRMGPVSFWEGGGGTEVSCPNIFSSTCPKTLLAFCGGKMPFEKFKGEGAAAPYPHPQHKLMDTH